MLTFIVIVCRNKRGLCSEEGAQESSPGLWCPPVCNIHSVTATAMACTRRLCNSQRWHTNGNSRGSKWKAWQVFTSDPSSLILERKSLSLSHHRSSSHYQAAVSLHLYMASVSPLHPLFSSFPSCSFLPLHSLISCSCQTASNSCLKFTESLKIKDLILLFPLAVLNWCSMCQSTIFPHPSVPPANSS